MSKKLCKDEQTLRRKMKGRKKTYLCTKCDLKSPKEKWCCKPVEIEQ